MPNRSYFLNSFNMKCKNELRHCREGKKYLSEVGFEPTPTEVDCDLNAAP